MPKVQTGDHGTTIRWGIAEKVVGGVITALVIIALTTSVGMYVEIKTIRQDVNRNTQDISAGKEGAVLTALSNIQDQMTNQTRILAGLAERMTGVEQEIRDAREERMRIEDRIDRR